MDEAGENAALSADTNLPLGDAKIVPLDMSGNESHGTRTRTACIV